MQDALLKIPITNALLKIPKIPINIPTMPYKIYVKISSRQIASKRM